MNEANREVVISGTGDSSSKKLKIPANPTDLATFISGLLGQAQTLERTFYGKFCINLNWLIAIDDLLSQRIHQQHKASLVDFSATFYYEDNFVRNVSSVEEFITYNEPQDIISDAVQIKWTYLVNFHTKNTPEKQEITLTANAVDVEKIDVEGAINSVFENQQDKSFIQYSIDYTERTWGDDISALLTTHIKRSVESEPKYKNAIRIVGQFLGYFLIIFSWIIPSLIQEQVRSSILKENYYSLLTEYKGKEINLELISSKLDQLFLFTSVSTVNYWGVLLFLISTIIFVFIGVMLLIKSKRPKRSFVILNESSQKLYDSYTKKQTTNYWMSIFAFLISIIASISANYIYYLLTVQS